MNSFFISIILACQEYKHPLCSACPIKRISLQLLQPIPAFLPEVEEKANNLDCGAHCITDSSSSSSGLKNNDASNTVNKNQDATVTLSTVTEKGTGLCGSNGIGVSGAEAAAQSVDNINSSVVSSILAVVLSSLSHSKGEAYYIK